MKDILSFLGTGGGLISLLAFLKWYINYRAANKQKRFPVVVSNIDDLYDTLQEYRRTLGAHRIMVVKAHNGGGRPSITTPMKSSVLYEVYDESGPAFKPAWQNEPADESFNRMLRNLEANKTVELKEPHRSFAFDQEIEAGHSARFGKGSTAQTLYQQDKVSWSFADELHIGKTGYFFLVVDMVDYHSPTSDFLFNKQILRNRIIGHMWSNN